LTYTTTDIYSWRGEHDLLESRTPEDAGFADFCNLESVSLVGICPNFERAVLTSRAPPNLKNLTFQARYALNLPLIDHPSANENICAVIPFLRAPSSSVPPTLKNIDLIWQDPPKTRSKLPKAVRTFVELSAEATKKMGIKLRVLSLDRSNYFPPFLYGEPVPQLRKIFDEGFTEGLKAATSSV
jgi:hypothetical protein